MIYMNSLKGNKQTAEHIAKRVAAFKEASKKPRDRKKVLLSKIKIEDNGCWVWQGAVFKKQHGNYGMLRIGKRGESKTYRAHRISYEQFVGEIPKGLELDHKCRNTLCINPEHLEPVTHTENMRRRPDVNQPHCKRGHDLTGNNLLNRKDGRRECKVCKKASSKASYLRIKERREHDSATTATPIS